MSPDTHPFDLALRNMRADSHFRDALVEVGDTVDMAKKILLQSRVRDFTGADVVALTQMILQREQTLADRAAKANSEDENKGVF